MTKKFWDKLFLKNMYAKFGKNLFSGFVDIHMFVVDRQTD
jgi:hypothetical protein